MGFLQCLRVQLVPRSTRLGLQDPKRHQTRRRSALRISSCMATARSLIQAWCMKNWRCPRGRTLSSSVRVAPSCVTSRRIGVLRSTSLGSTLQTRMWLSSESHGTWQEPRSTLRSKYTTLNQTSGREEANKPDDFWGADEHEG